MTTERKAWFRNCLRCAYGGRDEPRCRRYRLKPEDGICWTDNGDRTPITKEEERRWLPMAN